MSILSIIKAPVACVRGLLRRREIQRELDEELAFHFEHEVEENVRRGMPVAEAARIARLDLGGLAQTREAVGDVRSVWLESVWRDVRLAVRLLKRDTSFAVTVGLTLAVCLGANAALFAVIDHVLLRPLPFPESDRIVITGDRYPKAVSTQATARRQAITSIVCTKRPHSPSRRSSKTGATTSTNAACQHECRRSG